MRRDQKNTVFWKTLNTDVDCSFANIAAWNAGRQAIDLWGGYQLIKSFQMCIYVAAKGTTISLFAEESSDGTTWTELKPYRDEADTSALTAITAVGHYAAEYRETKRYVRLSASAQTGTFVMYAYLIGSASDRSPVERSHVTYI